MIRRGQKTGGFCRVGDGFQKRSQESAEAQILENCVIHQGVMRGNALIYGQLARNRKKNLPRKCERRTCEIDGLPGPLFRQLELEFVSRE
jgi:hypothetical protein